VPLYISGFHAIEETLLKGRKGLRLLYCKKNSRINQLSSLARRKHYPVEFLRCEELENMSGISDHRGVILQVEEAPAGNPADLADYLDKSEGRSLVLILDGITDPHNLGAILRSADQFAVDRIVVPKRRSAKETETVKRTSAGASNYTALSTEVNINRVIDDCKTRGFWVYGADISGKSLLKVDFPERCVLVLGGEGKGLSRLTKEKCDELVCIPSAGHVDSFNVSVAAGILLYEIRRAQQFFTTT
jgi:23S rRNA (guanosine2251-2'-O)-methyltransferase